MKKLLLAVPVLICLFCCKKSENAVQPVDTSYFPTNIGHYVIYDVDSAVIIDFGQPSKIQKHYYFQIKEIVESSFTDLSGRTVQRVEAYRKDSTADWTFDHAFTIALSNNTGERTEKNRRYVLLPLPPVVDKTWKSPSWFTNDTLSWEYKYTSINSSATIGGTALNNLVTVTQINDSNAIKRVYSEERYAPKIGLVYKKVYKDSSNTIDGPYNDRIAGGIYYTLTYKSHGN